MNVNNPLTGFQRQQRGKLKFYRKELFILLFLTHCAVLKNYS